MMENRAGGINSIFNILAVGGIALIVLIVASTAYVGAKKDARDEQRASDVDSIVASLNNYQTDNNRFPDSVQGRPVGLEQYLDRWPEAPEPSDGTCQKDQNRYVYQTFNNGSSYSLSFCLGGKAGGHRAGFQTIKAP